MKRGNVYIVCFVLLIIILFIIFYISKRKMRTSIVTACKNRNFNLKLALPSWLSAPVYEIVIVDWSSDESVFKTVKEILESEEYSSLNVPKIKIIEVKDKPKWILSQAFNLGVRMAKGENILKLDCDYVIETGFFDRHKLDEFSFITGNWKNAKDRSEHFLNGALFIHKKNLQKVSGYNEYLTKYGYDDSDLYDRLMKQAKLKKMDIDNKYIRHLEHPNSFRQSDDTFKDIHCNRFLSEILPWSAKEKLGDFDASITHYVVNFHKVSVYVGRLTNCVEASLEKILQANAKFNIFSKSQTPPLENVLYVNVCNGLGNKLRSLASAHTFFSQLNFLSEYNQFKWRLVIIWKKDEHCMAGFDDLFKIEHLPPNVSIITEMPVLSQEVIRISSYTFSTEDIRHCPNINCFLDKIKSNKDRVSSAFLETAVIFNFPKYFLSVRDSWLSDCKFLKSLKLNDKITRQIELLKENITQKSESKMSELIGLHVRLGQSGSAWDDVSGWNRESRESWEKHRKHSSLEKFIEVIEKNKNAKGFYVASDTEEVYETLDRLFPGKMFYNKREVFDRSREQVESGLVDLFLLGSTGVCYGSNWSSYSESLKRLFSIEVKLAGVDF